MDLKYILHNKIEFFEGKIEKIRRRKKRAPAKFELAPLQSGGIVLNRWARYKLMIP
jgi:hypothetical protein